MRVVNFICKIYQSSAQTVSAKSLEILQ